MKPEDVFGSPGEKPELWRDTNSCLIRMVDNVVRCVNPKHTSPQMHDQMARTILGATRRQIETTVARQMKGLQ